MPVILLTDKNRKTLTEAPWSPASGDKTARTVAKGGQHIDKAKSRLGDLGIHSIPSVLDGIYTIEQLSIEPFKFNFLIQVQDEHQELTEPTPTKVESLARVVDTEPLTLECKVGGEIFTMVFTEGGELSMKLPGTKKSIQALTSSTSAGKGRDSKFYTVTIDNLDVITNQGDENKEGGDKEGEKKGKEGEDIGNYYNGKDIKEVNQKLDKVKEEANFFKVIEQYKNDTEFQNIFLDAIINSTKSIRINKNPLLKTLTELKNNGILEDSQQMSGSRRKFLKIKLNLQNFMVEVFSLFAKVAKSGKQSMTFDVIKKFYRELYMIAVKGKSHISDEKTRNVLWRKLMGTFSNFLHSIRKLKPMTKGSKPKDDGKNITVKNTPKATLGNTTESIVNNISDSLLIIEQGGVMGVENANGKIYITNIELGRKAEIKRGADVDSYNKSQGGGTNNGTEYDGTTLSLPNKEFVDKKINFQLVSEDKLNDAEKAVFKEIVRQLKTSKVPDSPVKVRRSEKDDNTLVIQFSQKSVIVCKVKPGADLRKNMINNEVLVSPNAGGEDVVKNPTKAYLQILNK